jgi:hypothetical protein
MMKKVVVLIDGGNLRVLSRRAGYAYEPAWIERVAHAFKAADEETLRILYYDCAPYRGTTRLPVSGQHHEFTGSDAWLRELACKDLFAIRLGVLKFRGFKPRSVPVAR